LPDSVLPSVGDLPRTRYLPHRLFNFSESSFLSVKEIAYRVGLNDESHFVRDFKSTYGSSPALYRTRFKNKISDESHNGNNGNGNGTGNGNGNQPGNIQKQLAQIAKHSVLPSIQLFFYVFSYL
jgi:hypothetical protein